MICTPHQIFFGGQIKDWMGGACGIWGRNGMHTGFWWVNLKRQFARPWCRWKYNIKIGDEYILWEGVDWIHLAEDTQKW
jgi:hypothetical protein